MYASKWLGAVLVVGCGLGACGEADGAPCEEVTQAAEAGEGEGSPSSMGEESDAGTAEDAPAAGTSEPFEGFVANTALWADFVVEVLDARVERGLDELRDQNGGVIHDDLPYLEVDLRLTNRNVAESELDERRTWDVVLADGTRLRQSNAFSVSLAAGDSAEVTLRHAMDGPGELAGAQLELNGSQRGRVAPERIPLDAPYQAPLERDLVEVAGTVVEPEVLPDWKSTRYTIHALSTTRNSLEKGRAESGGMFVELDLAAVALEDEDTLQRDDMRIVVDGERFQPVNFPNEIISMNTTVRVPVVFEVDDTVTEFGLDFHTATFRGDSPDGWVEVRVTL